MATLKIEYDKLVPNAGIGRKSSIIGEALRILPKPSKNKTASVFVPGKKISDFGGSIAWFVKKNPGSKFACRSVTENGVQGVRVWRVK